MIFVLSVSHHARLRSLLQPVGTWFSLKGVGCPGLKLFEGPPIPTARVIIVAVVLVFATVSDPEVCNLVFVAVPRVDVSNDVGLSWCYYLVISFADSCNFHSLCFKGALRPRWFRVLRIGYRRIGSVWYSHFCMQYFCSTLRLLRLL